MRRIIILLSVLLGAVSPAFAQISVGIGMPTVSIGINLPVFPRFEMVPGYPVYYAPQVDTNYFFYDGMYWVYEEDNWYASSWYNGPWALVSPMVVPVYILRVPVRYYREPPVYFRGWRQEEPPRWGDHWGRDWERQRSGWDHWNRNSVPPPAPLPTYQQQYSGRHYPPPEQQRVIASQNYRYQPHDPVVKQHYDKYEAPTAAAPSQRDSPPQESQAQPPRESERQSQREAQRQPPQPEQYQRPPDEAQRQPPQPEVQHQPQQGREPQHEPPQSERQREPQQQPLEDRDRGPSGGEKAAKQPKPEQGRQEDRDNGAGKEGQQDNR